MIEQAMQDSWREAIKERFRETGLMGDFDVLSTGTALDHNLINKTVDKQTKAVFREVFAEPLEMTKNLLNEIRDIICGQMEEGPVRDSYSNYEFSPDDVDDLFKEMLR